ncbi:MAG: PorT family protein [Bacteroidia bacterium]|nr:PorT family protein [Bacteroidia bacterium]
MKTLITLVITACSVFSFAQKREVITIISNDDTTQMYVNDNEFIIQNKSGSSENGDRKENKTIIRLGDSKFTIIDIGDDEDIIIDEKGDTLDITDPKVKEEFELEIEEMMEAFGRELSETLEQLGKDLDFSDFDFNFSIDTDDDEGDNNEYRYEYKYKSENEDGEGTEEIIIKSSSSSSNSNTSKNDTINIQIGKKRILVISEQEELEVKENEDDDSSGGSDKKKDESKVDKSKSVKTHYLLLNLGVNSYLSDNGLKLPVGYDFLDLNLARSIAVNLMFFETHINLIKEYVQLQMGMGLDYNNYRFIGDFSFVPDTDMVLANFNESYNYKKNKLTTKYVNVPVLIQFQTKSGKKKKSFRFAAGVDLGYYLKAYTKQVYEIEGKKYKDKIYDDYNLEKLRYGILTRIGYGNMNFFAKYSLTPLFEEGINPELNPVTIGVAIMGI